SLPPYRIIIGLQEVACLPWKVFFWKKPDTVAFDRFDPVLFSARGMGPYIPDGMPVIKLVAGVPGDRVKIKEGKLYIN
ncbi:S26 family signal peptidase, partial [Neisseria sp. P0015.S006]